MEKVRKAIRFYGRVQGVGFRWRARQAAVELGLTGWVRNEYDGSVSMEVQGEEGAISRMLGLLDAGSWIHIEAMETQRIPLIPAEKDFRVKGY